MNERSIVKFEQLEYWDHGFEKSIAGIHAIDLNFKPSTTFVWQEGIKVSHASVVLIHST